MKLLRPKTLLLLIGLAYGVSRCVPQERFRILIPTDKTGAYIDVELREGGWLTAHQFIHIIYGCPTSLFRKDQKKEIGVYELYAPDAFLTYNDLTTEWKGKQRLLIHSTTNPDLIINLAEYRLEGALRHTNSIPTHSLTTNYRN
ncbi:hypothetical protein J0X19_07030 [Hymenobacter sp. BT186]|uniref:Uncharacterized protein n=1 Tax=Hymenobacter telluris TaxID=2816474 RepID=A0A939EUI8_9BACT|nr:hypothetical protein [Hymenobacter telluris]MBO0357693.1 hypothetical protein [Hymenobacter telluris]MBW3373720.1 hypothetical protein [Hymenobacter norwichensis]